MKSKIVSIPPNYIYFSLAISAISYYLLPSLNIIPSPFNYSGWILIFIGLLLTYWSWLCFKKHGTPEDFSESKALVIDGPFKFSRNPMYLGMFIITLGAAVCFKNLIGILVSVFVLLVMHFMFIPFEEEKNEKTFGQAFLDYKIKVRKWL
jgi:protein-S-isoprenylcysteine O-methyltransferase Ste14